MRTDPQNPQDWFLLAADRLRKTHDLTELLAEAMLRDDRFQQFEDLCESLTEQFSAQHYPGGDLTDVGADYDELRRKVGELVQLISPSMNDV